MHIAGFSLWEFVALILGALTVGICLGEIVWRRYTARPLTPLPSQPGMYAADDSGYETCGGCGFWLPKSEIQSCQKNMCHHFNKAVANGFADI